MKKIFFWMIAIVLCSVTVSWTTKNEDGKTSADNALRKYLNNGDQSYNWSINDTFKLKGVTGYELILTSQKWRDITWRHQFTILVPSKVKHEEALLFISGGSNKNSAPNLRSNSDDITQGMAMVASNNNSIVAILRQVPNQPLFDNLKEDALISYTLHQYKESGDFTWPLLFPMVKSAVRAMDAVEEFSAKHLDQNVNQFVVSGLSKRGWTTWLTGASDTRVKAIAPMVIDVLNMPVSLQYQIDVWNDYSPEIQDYVNLEIPQQVQTDNGQAITQMVDPYSYRENLDMPKMLFMGTNDPYWPVDAVKNYIDSIPGQNFIHYVPNAGHDLGDAKQALAALSAFYGFTINDKAYPQCKWDVETKSDKVVLSVTPEEKNLVDAILWRAFSEDRDFRNDTWTGKSLNAKKKDLVTVEVPYTDTGFQAFYIDLIYKDVNGDEFSESTRMFVMDEDEIFE